MTAVWVDYKERKEQAWSLAAIVAGQLDEALNERGKAALAVPGGTTPAEFLSALSDAQIDWANVSVVLTDERQVPETSERSNENLLRETLLQGEAKAANFISMSLLPRHSEAEHAEVADSIRKILPLDVCVLGMGTDQHIASLFPGAAGLADALSETCEDVVTSMRPKRVPEPRVTLTAPVIQGARHLHLIISGKRKLDALKRAEKLGPPVRAPVRIALNAPGGVVVHYSKDEK